MKKYHIIKLYKEKYDFLIIATSYHNPLGYIEEISEKIKVNQARILFDLSLINGLNTNRYILCNFYKGKNYLQSCEIVKTISTTIKKISHSFFLNNEEIVQNSVIPKAAKFLIKKGH